MGAYNGGDGNDYLVGTERNDVFRPGIGQDRVEGGLGIDTMYVDYTAANTGNGFETHASFVRGASGFDGYIGNFTNEVQFTNIDSIVMKDAGHGSDVYVDATVLLDGAGARLNYDAGAGGGNDVLELNLGNRTGAFVSGTAAGIKIGTGLFTNFEGVIVSNASGAKVALGATSDDVSTGGDNNRISTGAGNDTITSNGTSGDIIDGGDGTDSWNGFYDGYGSLTFDDRSGIKGLVTLRNVEQTLLTVGGGGNTYNIYGDHATIYNATAAGSVANINFQSSTISGNGSLQDHDDGVVVHAFKQTAASETFIDRVETVNYRMGSGDDYMSIALSGTTRHAITVVGGAGFDTLHIDTYDNPDVGALTFAVDKAGRVASNIGKFSGFEAFDIHGGNGNDVLQAPGSVDGGAGDDVIMGGATLTGDALTGGDGFDTISYANAGAKVTVSLALQGDGQSQDTGWGVDVLDGFEKLVGSRYADTLTGSDNNDTIDGGGNGDRISGGAGDDTLFGGDGNDTLTGGIGSDWMTGGAGADRFIFASTNDFNDGPDATYETLDRIIDFSHAEGDKIAITFDANPEVAGFQHFQFVSPDQAVFNSYNHPGTAQIYAIENWDGYSQVVLDANGDAIADHVFLVHTGDTPLVASDFIL